MPSPAPEPTPLGACREDLSGEWRDEKNDDFRYLAHDDGGVLVLDSRHSTRDGGLTAAQVILVRSGASFVGAVGSARVQADGGCAALFPVEVVSCADAGLLLSTVDHLRVDGACRTLDTAQVRQRHRLVRVPSDAGP